MSITRTDRQYRIKQPEHLFRKRITLASAPPEPFPPRRRYTIASESPSQFKMQLSKDIHCTESTVTDSTIPLIVIFKLESLIHRLTVPGFCRDHETLLQPLSGFLNSQEIKKRIGDYPWMAQELRDRFHVTLRGCFPFPPEPPDDWREISSSYSLKTLTSKSENFSSAVQHVNENKRWIQEFLALIISWNMQREMKKKAEKKTKDSKEIEEIDSAHTYKRKLSDLEAEAICKDINCAKADKEQKRVEKTRKDVAKCSTTDECLLQTDCTYNISYTEKDGSHTTSKKVKENITSE
eukprot:MONOS_10794.1-p1 / transcript=MONOS_10794.1 / gene=MONOS_10794 / organism=Monocercomonoides_exilis_PA203 / gene_product=unspecified product / transcript_product=unspecified product / location=Mono_scaffold00505:27301-28321(+) / protein_length=294 / sequence_SO=supercontig / SO=protein_coding / is_pseudo=false